MSAPSDGAYDRWSLRDPSTIDYGYFPGSNNGAPPAAAATTTTDADGGEKKGFYITTAINYTNGPAHMGHAYEAATTDAIARFARLNVAAGKDGNDPNQAYFVTGADEHGEKIAKTAEKEGKEPIEICDKVCVIVIAVNDFVVICFLPNCLLLYYVDVVSGLYWAIWTFT